MTAAVSGSYVIKVVVGTLIDLHAQWRGVGVHEFQSRLHILALLGRGPVVTTTDQHEYRNAKRFGECVAAPGVERDGGAELVRRATVVPRRERVQRRPAAEGPS